MNRQLFYMRSFIAAVVAVFVVACASMGRPEGGPRDETPPVFVGSMPAPGATDVKTQRITIRFNENVQVKDVMTKVVVSPPQKTMPKVSAVGRQVRVDMADTLLANTTYTVDFTDAISDLNESNELEGFSFAFSTGPTIDSLEISGMVFQASNLEPAQGMLVGVYSNLSDTAITTVPFERITRTNQFGQFTIRNLKEGTYRIFAINDVNRDNKWDRSEDVAFYDQLITPTSRRVEVADTLLSSTGEDSIVMRMATAFFPDDILLTWFNEDYKAQYIAKYERRDRNRIYLEMGAPCVEMPRISFVGGPNDGQRIDRFVRTNASRTLDTLDVWIADSSVLMVDSMRLSVSYQRQDSLENLVWTTDTLNFNYRPPKASKKKKEEKPKDREETDSAATPSVKLLKITNNLGPTVDVFAPVVIQTDQPLIEFKPEMVHLEQMVDTVWNEIDMQALAITDSLKPMRLSAEVKWEPGAKYRLTIDSLAMTGIYGQWNGNEKSEFTVRELGDYSSVTFNITGAPPGPAIAELLTSTDTPVRTVPVEAGRAVFRYVMPGTYYARLYIDRDSSGTYTGGKLSASLQPEDVYYYPKKLNLKKNWDVEQAWDLNEVTVDQQKPMEIKKNKPKAKKGQNDMMRGDEDEDDQYYDEFGNPAVDPNDPFGKKKNSRYNTLNGRDTNTGTQGAGYLRR